MWIPLFLKSYVNVHSSYVLLFTNILIPGGRTQELRYSGFKGRPQFNVVHLSLQCVSTSGSTPLRCLPGFLCDRNFWLKGAHITRAFWCPTYSSYRTSSRLGRGDCPRARERRAAGGDHQGRAGRRSI